MPYNNENIITDFSDGKDIRRKEDYDNKKPVLVCFNGNAYKWKDIVKYILNLMKTWKGQVFEEEILKIRTSTGILFSKSSDEIFNHKLIDGIYVEKVRYESASNNYIIELCFAILEQFKYKKALKILSADEKYPYKVDIRSIENIIWGESGDEYAWDLDDFNGIHHGYLKIPDISNIYDKIPEVSVYNQEITIIDYKDGEILDRHIQASHKGELRIGKPLYKKHGISTDSIIDDNKQFKVRCGFLYHKIKNYVFFLDFQEKLTELKIAGEDEKKKNMDKNILIDSDKVDKEKPDTVKHSPPVIGTDSPPVIEIDDMETKDIYITRYIDNNELIPDDIPDNVKDEIKNLISEDKEKIEVLLRENKSQILKSAVKDYYSKVTTKNEIIEKAKEKENIEREQKKKEEKRRARIDQELDVISNLPYDDLERMLHYNKNVDLDGPPYVGKTYSAKDCAVRYISRFVEAETDDKLNEFISKGYIEVFPSHSNLDYSDFVEGYKYDESGRPVLKPGILKIMSSRALGSVVRLDDKDINNKNWIEIFNMFKEKKKIMSKKEIDELFKYAIPRVLIIPDLTRGDVASILGPTNTIIDKPYRLGETEGMTIVLPDSGEEFGIPSILHIIVDRNNSIGTSVSYLDEATERRFPTKFVLSNFDDIKKYICDNREELESKDTYDILLESKKAMIKLNKRIIKKFGKDKELGHCYLYVKTPYELFTKWKNLIIPLIFRHRCRRDYKELNNILFNDDESQWISHEEGIYGLNNIEDLKSFIDKINNVPDQNE